MAQVSDLTALKTASDGDYFIESDRGIDYQVKRVGIDSQGNLVTERISDLATKVEAKDLNIVDTGGNTDYRPFIPIHAPIKEMRVTFGDRRYTARDQIVIFTGKELASGKSGWAVTTPNQWKLFSITGWNMGGDGGYYNWDMYTQSEAGYMHFSFQDTHNNQRNVYGAIKRIEVDYAQPGG